MSFEDKIKDLKGQAYNQFKNLYLQDIQGEWGSKTFIAVFKSVTGNGWFTLSHAANHTTITGDYELFSIEYKEWGWIKGILNSSPYYSLSKLSTKLNYEEFDKEEYQEEFRGMLKTYVADNRPEKENYADFEQDEYLKELEEFNNDWESILDKLNDEFYTCDFSDLDPEEIEELEIPGVPDDYSDTLYLQRGATENLNLVHKCLYDEELDYCDLPRFTKYSDRALFLLFLLGTVASHYDEIPKTKNEIKELWIQYYNDQIQKTKDLLSNPDKEYKKIYEDRLKDYESYLKKIENE